MQTVGTLSRRDLAKIIDAMPVRRIGYGALRRRLNAAYAKIPKDADYVDLVTEDAEEDRDDEDGFGDCTCLGPSHGPDCPHYVVPI